MKVLTSVDPFRCRMWALHDRLDEYILETTCRAEIESFGKYGQQIAALGRPLVGDPDYDIELIFGARRLFVARHLNKPLVVEVRDISDKEAIVAMDIENRHRQDISPYERGLNYARCLRSGNFSGQDEIARALKVSNSQVSRLLKLAQLPSVIVDAFERPTEIREGWGLKIADALNDNEQRQAVIQRARLIVAKSPRPSAPEVYRSLLAAAEKRRRLIKSSHDEVIKAPDGSTLFRIRHHHNSVAIILPGGRMTGNALPTIRELLRANLQQLNGH